jgi:DNA-directed RNA polymerase subunit beta'
LSIKIQIALTTHYNSLRSKRLYVKDKAEVKKGELVCDWDPYNAVIISELSKVALLSIM